MGVESDGDVGKNLEAIKRTEAEVDVDKVVKEDGAVAAVDDEKDEAAHRLAAAGVARAAEAKRLMGEAQKRKAADEAENKTNKMTRRMGALQVRGSQADAEEISWMLSGGDGPAEWGKVLYNDKTNTQLHRTKLRWW